MKASLKSNIAEVSCVLIVLLWVSLWLIGKSLGFISFEWLEVLFVAFAPIIISFIVVTMIMFSELFSKE